MDYREDKEYPTVSIPFEFFPETASRGTVMTLTDRLGEIVGKYPVKTIINRGNKTYLVKFQVPDKISRIVAGVRVQEGGSILAFVSNTKTEDDAMSNSQLFNHPFSQMPALLPPRLLPTRRF